MAYVTHSDTYTNLGELCIKHVPPFLHHVMLMWLSLPRKYSPSIVPCPVQYQATLAAIGDDVSTPAKVSITLQNLHTATQK